MRLLKTFYSMSFFIGLCSLNLYAMNLDSEQIYNLLINGKLDELKDFFTKRPDLLNKPVSAARPSFPLNYCLWRNKSEQDTCEAIQIIIDCGANMHATLPDHVEKNTYVPLFVWAMSMHSTDILDVLVKNGADINQKDRHGAIIHKLIYYRSKTSDLELFLKLVKRTLEHGADPGLTSHLGVNCLSLLNLIKLNTENSMRKEYIKQTEALLKNAPFIRAAYLEEQRKLKLTQKLQKGLIKFLLQPNNLADIAININGKTYSLHTAILSARYVQLSNFN